MTAPAPRLTLECMAAQLRRGTALVDAALAALDRLGRALDEGAGDPAALRAILEGAAVDGDNLLLAEPGRRRRTTVFTLARSAAGPVRVQTLDLDAAALAGGAPLGEAVGSGLLGERARAAASALSVARSRLDLQASFLDAVLGAEAPPIDPGGADPGEAVPDPSIRALALAAGRRLGRERLPLAARNRRTLEALFARAADG